MKVQRKRVLRWLLSLCAGIGLCSAASAPQAQGPVPTPIPQHWISYAGMVGAQFAQWLSDAQDAAVVQLHTQLQDRVLKEGKPPLPPLVARVWVGTNGVVSRVVLPPTGDTDIDAALQRLLSARALPEPPPPDMRQPLVLQLSLDFAPVPVDGDLKVSEAKDQRVR